MPIGFVNSHSENGESRNLSSQDLDTLEVLNCKEACPASIFDLGSEAVGMAAEIAHVIFASQFVDDPSLGAYIIGAVNSQRELFTDRFEELVLASRSHGSLLDGLLHAYEYGDRIEFDFSYFLGQIPRHQHPADKLFLRLNGDRGLRDRGFHFELLIVGGSAGLSGAKAIHFGFKGASIMHFTEYAPLPEPDSTQIPKSSTRINSLRKEPSGLLGLAKSSNFI